MDTTVATQKGHEHPGHSNEVTISLDGVPRQIQRGNYLVAELKRLLQIDPCRDLDEVVCGELRPLEDSSKMHIKGGESFISHVRCGASS
jgi:hypothetical protein